MNETTLNQLEKILPHNSHNLDITLFHVSDNIFKFPKQEFLRTSYEKHMHHIKSAMGLWLCNNNFVSNVQNSNQYHYYKCQMKPETKWTIVSYSNFVKIFNILSESSDSDIFNFYDNLSKQYDVFILISEDINQDTVSTEDLSFYLNTRKEEIIVLNLDMIASWTKENN